jgi:hypothetical protein
MDKCSNKQILKIFFSKMLNNCINFIFFQHLQLVLFRFVLYLVIILDFGMEFN